LNRSFFLIAVIGLFASWALRAYHLRCGITPYFGWFARFPTLDGVRIEETKEQLLDRVPRKNDNKYDDAAEPEDVCNTDSLKREPSVVEQASHGDHQEIIDKDQ
jgi:hypothetical protein